MLSADFTHCLVHSLSFINPYEGLSDQVPSLGYICIFFDGACDRRLDNLRQPIHELPPSFDRMLFFDRELLDHSRRIAIRCVQINERRKLIRTCRFIVTVTNGTFNPVDTK